MKIGFDINKEIVYVTAMDKNGNVIEQYEITKNNEE